MAQRQVERPNMVFVEVTHIEDAITFWAHNENLNQAIAEMSKTLADICPKAQRLLGIPCPQKIYGARFSEDNCWYRCKVQEHTDDKFNVSYIDYGNTEVVVGSSIVELPAHLQTSSLAHKYRLWGLHISSAQASSVSQQGKAFAQNMIYGKKVRIQKKYVICDGTILVQAFQGSLDIGEELLKMKFVVLNRPEGNHDSLLGIPSLQKLQDVSAPWVQQMLRERDHGDDISTFPVSMPKLRPVLSDQRPQMEKETNGSQPVNVVEKNVDQDLLEENKRLKAELDLQKHNLQQKEEELKDASSELQRLKEKHEIDVREAETAKKATDKIESESLHLKEQLHDSERTLQNLKVEVLEQQKKMDKLLDTAVAEQFSQLATKVDALRRLRGNCLSADDGVLAESINTVIHNGVSAPATTAKLEVAWRDYSLAQEKLRECKTEEDVGNLINQRNEVLRVLMATVEGFLKEAKVLPVRKRMETLEEVHAALTAVFGQFSMEDVGDHIYDEYSQWRTKKRQHVNGLKDDTDKALNALATWTASVSKFFCVSSQTPVALADVVDGVSDILKQAELSLCKELEVLDSAEDTSSLGCTVVTSAFHKVMQDIEKEKRVLSDIMEKYLFNLKFKGEMLQWQIESPTPATLLSIKKQIRTLRLLLRLKQVEEGNLENDEDLDLTEISKKKEEIAETRKALFKEISQEKEEYKKLSDLVDGQFPELPLLYPEIDIQGFMRSGGLMMRSLDREMFDAEPMKELSGQRPLVCTEFQGQRIILKGYTINEETEPRMLEQTTLFHRARTEGKEEAGILPLLALFFSKCDPVAYVMVPYFPNGSLKAVQAVQPLTPTEVAMVMKGVVQGLQALHAVGITHGSINPNNVFVRDRVFGLLGDFDFTKTPEQRVARNGMMGSINLVSPELYPGSPTPTPAWDMCSVGGLLLWLHVPEFNSAHDSLEATKLEPNLQALLSNLLVPNGVLSAVDVLNNDYFLTVQ